MDTTKRERGVSYKGTEKRDQNLPEQSNCTVKFEETKKNLLVLKLLFQIRGKPSFSFDREVGGVVPVSILW